MDVSNSILRSRITISGAVQGVGFRPFIYRLARDLQLNGWVSNSAQGVVIEAEASREQLDRFLARIEHDKPPRAIIQDMQWAFIAPTGYQTFEIRHSESSGAKTALVLPDLATCPDCLRELFDPANRRYRYPFTNCTNCGPRFSIIEALPYDRPNTTMRHFPMCEKCQAEYDNPLDRRFHAQPNACPHCGPHLELWNGDGAVISTHDAALTAAVQALFEGKIVALKGIGGFQLLVAASNQPAVNRLRERKHRPDKPLALMYPSLESLKGTCPVSELEEHLLTSPEAPIVLLHRGALPSPGIASAIAPDNPYLGVMLPYSPLHYLLMAELNTPIVATSGNLSDEPICIHNHDALERLAGIADLFLVHNRPIARHVDDSIVRVVARRETVLRRARGYAPLPVQLESPVPSVIAVGAHLKNTIAASVDKQVFVSQHIGDLETPQSFAAFQRVIADFTQLYELQPSAIVCDLHPDYQSTRFAEQSGLPVIHVQHHYAHILACMAENHIAPPVLGISWDGTGYGSDGTIWGGECLQVTSESWIRAAHLQPFRLPGGDRAVKEPARIAISLLYELFGDDFTAQTDLAPLQTYSSPELRVLQTMLQRGFNAPLTSSMGRLFDGVAALIGGKQRVSYEGQAAMELEFMLDGAKTDECYPFRITPITSSNSLSGGIMEWKAMIQALLEDVRRTVPKADISAKFHNTLVEMIVAVARQVNETNVMLSGGCFQNRYLIERTIERLTAAGFHPYWHSAVPANDGGIALGQIAAAAREHSR